MNCYVCGEKLATDRDPGGVARWCLCKGGRYCASHNEALVAMFWRSGGTRRFQETLDVLKAEHLAAGKPLTPRQVQY